MIESYNEMKINSDDDEHNHYMNRAVKKILPDEIDMRRNISFYKKRINRSQISKEISRNYKVIKGE